MPKILQPGERCPDYLAGVKPIAALVKGFYFLESPLHPNTYYLIIDGQVKEVFDSESAAFARFEQLRDDVSDFLKGLIREIHDVGNS